MQVAEAAASNPTPINAAQRAGIDVLSQSAEITFTKYIRLILPLDGFVFWVNAALVGEGALYNAQQYNKLRYGDTSKPIPAPSTISVKGSLHYATDSRQEEDQTFGRNFVMFTCFQEIQDFNEISPDVMYLGEIDNIRFAFNQRASFYHQAGTYHYRGDALYPALASQIIDDVQQLDVSNVVVSNSLPIWLTLNQYMPMLPSFLITGNLEPPYASVHIPPETTDALQSVPLLDQFNNHTQLVYEKVKITMYGLRNFNALDFQDYVLNFCMNNDGLIGLMNMPVIRDEKRTQSELSIIAMKKSIEFEVNYYQSRMRNIAQTYILSYIPSIYIE